MTLEKNDIQGLVFSGHPGLPFASFLLLEVTRAPAARAYLGRLADLVPHGDQRRPGQAIHVALAHAGLAALGLGDDALATFPVEFVEGMAGTETRSRVLGDTGPSAPGAWVWGGKARPVVHLLLMIYARTKPDLDQLVGAERRAHEGCLREVYRRETVTPEDQREHFGFTDGLSQPRIEGSGASPAPGATFIAPGEFVLGYDNAYGKPPFSPTVAAGLDRGDHLRAPEAAATPAAGRGRRDLGRNGSYLVVRQLEQDVEGFWQEMYRQSGAEDGQPTEEKATLIASKCVGRWPSGAPLVLAPDRDDPAQARRNDFDYHTPDARGLACPRGAHIRRANPRDALPPGPDESKTMVNRHRLLRRGRFYGPRLAPFSREREREERGLLFIAVNANIRRQFEFVQQTWLNNDHFDGLEGERDPLVSDAPGAAAGTFTIPGPVARRRLGGMSGHVTTRGGEYFFLPGLAALRFLAALPDLHGG